MEEQKCPKDQAELVVRGEPADPFLNLVVENRLRIERYLGAGGMGHVYVGRQLDATQREVAVKFIRPEMLAHEEDEKRFFREIRTLASASHANVVNIFFSGHAERFNVKIPFFAMELLKGQPLSDVVGRGKRLPVERSIRITQNILRGLTALHDAGVLHRDLKPGNVQLLDPEDDQVKILDFGLAKPMIQGTEETAVTVGHLVMGTPAYMSPEQMLGWDLDDRSDLYAVGMILYELLTGHRPTRDTCGGVQRADEAFPELKLPADLCSVIQELVAMDIKIRPRTARDVLKRLQGIVAAPPIGEPAESCDTVYEAPLDDTKAGPGPKTLAAAGKGAAAVLEPKPKPKATTPAMPAASPKPAGTPKGPASPKPRTAPMMPATAKPMPSPELSAEATACAAPESPPAPDPAAAAGHSGQPRAELPAAQAPVGTPLPGQVPLFDQHGQPVYLQPQGRPVFTQQGPPLFTQQGHPVFTQQGPPLFTQQGQPYYQPGLGQPAYPPQTPPPYASSGRPPSYVQLPVGPETIALRRASGLGAARRPYYVIAILAGIIVGLAVTGYQLLGRKDKGDGAQDSAKSTASQPEPVAAPGVPAESVGTASPQPGQPAAQAEKTMEQSGAQTSAGNGQAQGQAQASAGSQASLKEPAPETQPVEKSDGSAGHGGTTAEASASSGATDEAAAREREAIRERLAKEEAEKAEKERAEKERLATEEAEKAEKEKAEKERLAKEAAGKAGRDKAEKERLAKEAAEKAEKERLAKEAAEKAEKERLAKEAAEKAEKERLAKEAAEKAEKERLEKEKATGQKKDPEKKGGDSESSILEND
jgi:serine/threonine-protein kinase